MPTLRIKALPRRGQTQYRASEAHAATVRVDTAWEAIVEQLSGPALGRSAARPDTEYAWARRLSMHINRPPKCR